MNTTDSLPVTGMTCAKWVPVLSSELRPDRGGGAFMSIWGRRHLDRHRHLRQRSE